MRKLLNKFFCFIFLLTFLTSCKGNNTNNSNENTADETEIITPTKVASDTGTIFEKIETTVTFNPLISSPIASLSDNKKVKIISVKNIKEIGSDDTEDWIEVQNLLSGYKLVEDYDSRPPLGCLYPIYIDGKTGFINEKGEEIVDCIFHEVYEINDSLVGIIYTDLDDAIRQMDIYLIFENGENLKIASENFLYNELNLATYRPGSDSHYWWVRHEYRYDNFKFKNLIYGRLKISENNLDKNLLYFSFQYDKSTSKYFKYDLKSKQLKEIEASEKILFYDAKDRKVFANASEEYWLEDSNGNILSDIFLGFIPEDYPNASPETYVFLERAKGYPASPLTEIYDISIVDKNGKTIFNKKLENSFGYECSSAVTKIKNNKDMILFNFRNVSTYFSPKGDAQFIDKDINYAININNLLNDNGNIELNDVLYSNDEIVVTRSPEGDSTTYIYNNDFNLISKIDTHFNCFLPLESVNEPPLYIAANFKTFYILDDNFRVLFIVPIEIEFLRFSLDETKFSRYNSFMGAAVDALGKHDIFLTDFLFYRKGEASFNPTYEEINIPVPGYYYVYNVEYTGIGKINLTVYKGTYGIYKLKEREYIELSDMYLKFYNKNMIMTKDAAYRNFDNEVIYDDLKELYAFPPNLNITLK